MAETLWAVFWIAVVVSLCGPVIAEGLRETWDTLRRK